MKDYSEFIHFIIEKTKINKPLLIEKDILLHTLLYRLSRNKEFRNEYLFKGGSCLVKCYFDYYRFSIDLDFTYSRQEKWKGLSKSSRRKELVLEAEQLASRDLGLKFITDIKNRRFIEFGSGSRLVTFKLYHRGELLKIQVNLVETLLFKSQKREVRSLLKGVSVTNQEKAYFRDFLKEYHEFEVLAYDLREILCEKVRAILTRRVQKLRDFYDLYILDKAGLKIKNYKNEIIRKLRPALKYRRYKEAFERNRRKFNISAELIADSNELFLFVKQPDREEFTDFLNRTSEKLREIMNHIQV
ncbi:MAG: hypothetical protein DRN04_18010 [Thermoprotei archaeon]|nr:MAG: hypothetical protein DRN04_18010 [Thermoprotei archaeon]